MKFSCSQKKLLNVLANSVDFTQSKASYSIYSNIFLQLEKNELTIKATNQNYGFKGTIDVKGEEDGALTLQADKFFDIVKNMSDEENIEFVSDEEFVNISSQVSSVNFKIRYISADNYNYPDQAPELEKVAVPQEVLIEMAGKVIISVSNDDSKPNICGVYAKFTSKSLEFVSTDIKSLTYYKKDFEFPSAVDGKEIIIPSKFIRDIMKVLPGSGVAELEFNENVLYVNFDNFSIWTTLIKGAYPKFGKIVDTEYTNAVILPKADIERMLKHVIVMSDSSKKIITFNFTEDRLTLTSYGSDELGFGKEDIGCEYKGKEVEFALFYMYLQNQLKVIDSDKVLLSFNQAKEPIRIEPAGGSKSYFNVIITMEV